MRSKFNTIGYLSVAIVSFIFGAMLGHSKWSITAARAALPQAPAAKMERATKEMAPDSALTAALKALADAKVDLFDSYEITMRGSDDKSSWGVWFVALPKSARHGLFRARVK